LFKVPEAKADEVIANYHNRSRLVEKAAGFRNFKLLQNEVRRGANGLHFEWDEAVRYVRSQFSITFEKRSDSIESLLLMLRFMKQLVSLLEFYKSDLDRGRRCILVIGFFQ
jgi:hypothetical protein